jgi:hypothetical protein
MKPNYTLHITNMKTTKFTRFLKPKWTKASLVPNPNHKIKKTWTRIQHVQNKNPIRFYYKNGTRIEQGYDKKNTKN